MKTKWNITKRYTVLIDHFQTPSFKEQDILFANMKKTLFILKK